MCTSTNPSLFAFHKTLLLKPYIHIRKMNMAIMRIISRLILRESPQSSSLRRLCTAPENQTPPQPKSRDSVFYAVVGAGPQSNVVDALNKWVGEGKPVKKSDIINLSVYFRSRKKHRAGIQVSQNLLRLLYFCN